MNSKMNSQANSTGSMASQNDTDLRPLSGVPQGRRGFFGRFERRTVDPLANLRVAAPCTEDWNRMRGDERVRDCGSCKMKVFNLSEMSADEARALIARAHKGERVCARFYRRTDGKVMTRDCRPGRTRLQRLRMKIAVTLFAAWAGGSAWLSGVSAFAKSRRDSQQTHFITGKIAAPGDFTADSQGPMLMGEVAPAQTPEPTPGTGGAPWAPWNTKPTPKPTPMPQPMPEPNEPPHHDREEPYSFESSSEASSEEK